MRMIVVAQSVSQGGPALDYVSRFRHIDPVLLDAVLAFTVKKNWLPFKLGENALT
jgi:hypothetical protein